MTNAEPESGFSILPTTSHTKVTAGEVTGFGAEFSPAAASARYSASTGGWGALRSHPLGDLAISPAAMVFHYGQAIFEGLKAFRSDNGSIGVFRPDRNAERFQRSAQRIAMPELPVDVFVDAVMGVVRESAALVPPTRSGSLYLRPFMIATEPRLGSRPSHEYLFMVLASPVGDLFDQGGRGIRVRLSGATPRAFPGGTGAAKCAGNYAAAQATYGQAAAEGFDQVVWLDAIDHRYVEELSGMNVFLVRRTEVGDELITPPLTDTLLAGVTRESVIDLGTELGLTVREVPIAWDWWRDEALQGRVTEAFACGTAAGVTAIGSVTSSEGSWTMADGGIGPVTRRLRELLRDIQYGAVDAHREWIFPVV